MAAKSAVFANQLLLLLFNNDALALIGDASGLPGSAVDGSLYISLHTANPTAGNQGTSEATYGGYARVAVARTAAEWAVTGASVENINAILFPACATGADTVIYFGIGTSAAGAGKLLYSDALSAARNISPGITPEFAAGDLAVTEA